VIEIALQDYPQNEWLKLARAGKLRPAANPDADRRVDWRAPVDDDALEKIIGRESTLLPIRFLELGLRRSRAVCRVVRADGASGTGFLVEDDLLLTNHHVLPADNTAAGAIAQFNYEETMQGLALASKEYRVEPHRGFATSVEHDWTAVRIQPGASSEWGVLSLTRTPLRRGDRVNIVQHPGGGPKRVGMYHNLVVFADDPPTRVQYLTDTMPGSSGSPVFDQQWNVVALHHSGGWLMEPGTKARSFRNEGIAAAVLLDGLAAAHLPCRATGMDWSTGASSDQ
jgi:hypothetical protein